MQPWKKVHEETGSVGRRKFVNRVFLRPDGEKSEFIIIDSGRPVCVFAITEDQQVILAKQFRPGPEEVLLELPGGFPEEGESPFDAARRELLEETGYVGDLIQIGEHLESAYDTRRTQDFVATNCKKGAEPHLDKEEIIEVVLMSLAEFRNHLRKGKLSDIETGYLGLDYLGLL